MIIYDRSELNSNMDCPYCCGKKMFANGCGGKGMKIVNKMLSYLPSSKLFHGACTLHDIAYALVSIAPIGVRYPNGKVVILTDRADCDNIWYNEMKELCNHVTWFKGIMRWAAKRNYKLVRKKGADFFKHEH